jgi:hypothetical protein
MTKLIFEQYVALRKFIKLKKIRLQSRSDKKDQPNISVILFKKCQAD